MCSHWWAWSCATILGQCGVGAQTQGGLHVWSASFPPTELRPQLPNFFWLVWAWYIIFIFKRKLLLHVVTCVSECRCTSWGMFRSQRTVFGHQLSRYFCWAACFKLTSYSWTGQFCLYLPSQHGDAGTTDTERCIQLTQGPFTLSLQPHSSFPLPSG